MLLVSIVDRGVAVIVRDGGFNGRSMAQTVVDTMASTIGGSDLVRDPDWAF